MLVCDRSCSKGRFHSFLTFADGKKGVYDFRPNRQYPCYRKHRDSSFFMQAKARYSTVVWPNDSDIDPELLYGAYIPEE